jgi:hypothetical protein
MTKSKEIYGIIDAGAEITGKSLSEATVGYIVGGEAGAVMGALVGGAKAAWAVTYKLMGKELAGRVLGHKEEQRVGATIIYSSEKFKKNLESGRQLRSDDYLGINPNIKPPIEENLEAVLLTAQREYEEKKLPYLGNLMGNLPFEPSISKEHANHLIKQANQLTYQQLTLLAVFAQSDEVKRNIYNLAEVDYRQSGKGLRTVTVGILHEAIELYNSGMLSCSGTALFGLADITPLKMQPQGNGAHLFNLMELSSIPKPDKLRVAKMF